MAQRSEVASWPGQAPRATLQIGLLGPLTLTRDGAEIDLSGPKRRALLILLALHSGSPVSVDRITEALWPDRELARAESTLRVHISHLRDTLEWIRDGSPEIVLTRGSAYLLAPETTEVDLALFDQLAGDARTLLEDDPEGALELLNQALGLWRGRPLQDVEYEEFAQPEIRRLRLARAEAITNRADCLIRLNRDAAAVEDLEALVQAEPTGNRPVDLLMRALYRTGRQADALRVYRRHSRHLADRGLETSPQMDLLEERIIQHDPTLLPEGLTSPGQIEPGRSVRGYELREEVGAGSIGTVYRAFQAAVGREVAVKVVHSELAESPEFVRRFAEEAKLIAGLEHPHIVPLYDFWREPVGAFLVMRWMDKGSLATRLHEPWEVEILGRVFDQLADALGYAHSAGVVHRDVKPANVLFDGQDNAYLSDFGLAVGGIETAARRPIRPSSSEPPYAPPELIQSEGPTVASDVYGLGALLAVAASEGGSDGTESAVPESLREVVVVATAPNPADRYPDMAAFRSALRQAIGPTQMPVPRRVRRNPYKGLEAFDEGDAADFYGRDDVVDTLIDLIDSRALTALIGASGSGKSSVVKAGLVPELRRGALAGSDEWFIIHMHPGVDPFEEFQIGLRKSAVGEIRSAGRRSRELRDSLDAALDGPNHRVLLAIDQFEEIFSPEIDEDTRNAFLDNLVDLVRDPSQRAKILLTIRADFSDRPLAHPRFGDLISKGSVLLAPMRPEHVEDAIRQPAARVGVSVEPGLISEIMRDVASAPGYLPLLQYVLAELFERRSEDRLTVSAYRSLGGVRGVLEQRAESTYSSLGSGSRQACRQLFLRMVHLGEHGDETRRRLPLADVRGLGDPADVDQALEAFSAARILTYDRDPVSRAPTVEVAHETVISNWTRFRIWIDEARADLLAHRRLSVAAASWSESGEDPTYLLTGGPLASALEVKDGDRISLNQLEARFIQESEGADEDARRREERRRREKGELQHRAKRRLSVGIGAVVVALVVGVLAVLAWNQRERASQLAITLDAQSRARELAAASVASLDSDDPDLSLLLAIEAAEQTIGEGDGEILDEAVNALHGALVNPRPALVVPGARGELGGEVLDFAQDGSAIAVLADGGGAFVIDPSTGDEIGHVPPMARSAFGIAFHPSGETVLTAHIDGVREWDWRTGEMVRGALHLPADVAVTAAVYSPDGSMIAVGGSDGVTVVFSRGSYDEVARLEAHEQPVSTLDVDSSGTRVATSATDGTVLFWDLHSERVIAEADTGESFDGMRHLAWHPAGDLVVGADYGGWIVGFDPSTGGQKYQYGVGNNPSQAVAVDRTGNFLAAAGVDGVARMFGALLGGGTAVSLPSGGDPLRDVAFDPSDLLHPTVATVGVDGNLRIFRDFLGSELPADPYPFVFPQVSATWDGKRFAVAGSLPLVAVPKDWAPRVEVVDQTTGDIVLSREILAGSDKTPVAISADGSTLAFAGPASGNVLVVDLESKNTTLIPESAVPRMRLALSADGALAAWVGVGAQIVVWDLEEHELVLEHHVDAPLDQDLNAPDRYGGIDVYQDFGAVEDLVFRPGARELAFGGQSGTVNVLKLDTGAVRTLGVLDGAVTAMAYSGDGSRFAAGDRRGNLWMVNADGTGDAAHLESVSEGLVDLAFSPRGSHLAGAGASQWAYVWNLESELIERRLGGAIYNTSGVVFTENGDRLRVLSSAGVLRGYYLDQWELLEAAREEVGDGELTENQCHRYLREACDLPRG